MSNYAPNNRGLKYTNKIWQKTDKEIRYFNSNKEFNILLIIICRKARHKTSQNIEDDSKSIDQIDTMNIYRILYPTTRHRHL